MRYLICGLFCVLSVECSLAQSVSVSLPLVSRVPYEEATKMTISAAGIPDSQIVVTTNNGEISKKYGSYYYRPKWPGISEIYVNDSICDRLNYLKTIKIPVRQSTGIRVYLNSVFEGDVSTQSLRNQIAPYVNYGYSNYYYVVFKGFDVVVVRDGEIIYEKTHRNETGCRFSDEPETQMMLRSLWIGDTFIVKNIIAADSRGIHFTSVNDIVLNCK